MLIAAAASLLVQVAWPAAFVGAASLALLVTGGRGRYTPAGVFGKANFVTLVRLALVVLLAVLGARKPGPVEAMLVLAGFTLDRIDRWLARRAGLASAFGARLDIECDALLVLICALVLYLHARVPAFILVPGLLRYAYV